jgi:hypothetical protein
VLYIQTIKNTQLWCHEKGRKKRRRKREKKNVFRVSDFCFFEKARDNFKKRESSSTPTQNRINTRDVGWNALRAPSHAEGMKTAFSSLFVMFMSSLTRVFTTTRRRDAFVFSTTNVFFRRRRSKISIPALTSLSDHLNLLSKR